LTCKRPLVRIILSSRPHLSSNEPAGPLRNSGYAPALDAIRVDARWSGEATTCAGLPEPLREPLSIVSQASQVAQAAYRDARWDAWHGIPRIRYAVPPLHNSPDPCSNRADFGSAGVCKHPYQHFYALALVASANADARRRDTHVGQDPTGTTCRSRLGGQSLGHITRSHTYCDRLPHRCRLPQRGDRSPRRVAEHGAQPLRKVSLTSAPSVRGAATSISFPQPGTCATPHRSRRRSVGWLIGQYAVCLCADGGNSGLSWRHVADGLSLPNGDECGDPRFVLELAERGEAAGWDGLFLEDDVSYQRDSHAPTCDVWTTLGAIAVRTNAHGPGDLGQPGADAGRRRWPARRPPSTSLRGQVRAPAIISRPMPTPSERCATGDPSGDAR